MPFPPTPSNTPSNTPTPSVTASVTPTVTPSNSACPNPTPSMTATITPTVPPCPCVCGAQVTNLSSVNTISYSYLNCNDISFSGTIAPSATLVLTCIEPEILVKWGSISTSGPATIVYGDCIGPTPTITATPTITPTITPSRDVPTIYLHLCVPDVIPADGRIYACVYATSENSCTGATTPVLDWVSAASDIGAIVDGEYISLFSASGCDILYPGDTCRCDCYYDVGPEASGYTISAVTYGIFTTGATIANYIHTLDCYTPECVQCIPTPTPTLTQTMTPTPSVTPSVTPTLTQTPTPSLTPPVPCDCYRFQNETGTADTVDYVICGGSATSESIPAGQIRYRCVEGGTIPTSVSITISQCSTNCTVDTECNSCT